MQTSFLLSLIISTCVTCNVYAMILPLQHNLSPVELPSPPPPAPRLRSQPLSESHSDHNRSPIDFHFARSLSLQVSGPSSHDSMASRSGYRNSTSSFIHSNDFGPSRFAPLRTLVSAFNSHIAQMQDYSNENGEHIDDSNEEGSSHTSNSFGLSNMRVTVIRSPFVPRFTIGR